MAGHKRNPMLYQRLCVVAATSMLMWSACVAPSATGEAPEGHGSSERLRGGGYSVVSESILDTTNRYLSTVRVITRFRRKEGTGFHRCSGVLIHPRLVLTAGHCVCMRRRSTADQEQFVVDRATCARTASIQTVFYKPLAEEEERGMVEDSQWPTFLETHEGDVRPNPHLKIVYASEMDNQELESHADLAVIHLSSSLKGKVGFTALAKEQIKVNDSIIMVGYGVAKPKGPEGSRRIGMNKVVSVEEAAGRIFRVTKPLFIPPTFVQGEPLFMREDGSYVLSGDSGGPSFREEADGTFRLVGIAKTAYSLPVEFSEYTSTYAYRDWIDSELASARRRKDTD